MKKINLKIVNGFTLAEVLITLGIIGVVAAMTIPTLMNNVQEAQFKTAWKKTYSIINQAYAKYLSDNSMTLTYGTWSNVSDMKIALKPYFSYVQECENGALLGVCWNSNGAYDKTTKVLAPNSSWWNDTNKNGIILKDGILLMFSMDGGYYCTGPSNANGNCGRVYVDVNGVKGPNIWGRDIYWVFLFPDRAMPYGSPVINGTTSADDCNTGSGRNCSYDYLVGN